MVMSTTINNSYYTYINRLGVGALYCFILFISILVFTFAARAGSCTEQCESLGFHFQQPGKDWESDTLPIGNGAIGASVLGGLDIDRVQFSEKTLWTGGPGSKQGYDFGLPRKEDNYPKRIKAIQTLLQQKQQLSPEFVAGKLGRQYVGYGSYQSFADLELTLSHEANKVTDYKRRLNISDAIASVNYQYEQTQFKREYFVSYPDNVMVIKLSSDQAAKLSMNIALRVPDNRTAQRHVKPLVTKSNKYLWLLTLSGRLNDNQLAYETNLGVVVNAGEVTLGDGNITVKNADSVWLVLSAGTDYALDYPRYRGTLNHQQLVSRVTDAIDFGFDALKKRHIDDYKALFERVDLSLNKTNIHRPIDEVLNDLKANTLTAKSRQALDVLYYQYGRYLLISSSRTGSLPANLQGVWNNYKQAPWNSDYHLNINLQMNYWLANTTNLAELNTPLFDFVDALQAPGELAAKRIFGVSGWVLFLNTNVWGFSGLIEWPTAFWQPEGAAWIALHYYQHYLFTGDDDFLKQRAYPVLKNATEFWLNTLVYDAQRDEYLVSPSYSPEHGDFSVGAAMSQQIVTTLLSNTLKSAQYLEDKAMIARITPVLDKLSSGKKVGAWGQLQEWQYDWDDKASTHRHVSHLFALHPSNAISPLKTPDLAKAAKTTLLARGDHGTGWSKAWKINFWARLFDGDHAYKLLSEQLKESTLKNLWDNHPPFQIDGNFGATAGMTEMLLQSQNNEIHVLPALPKHWPEGHIKGLKARGNITVAIVWEKHILTNLSVKSAFSQLVTVRADALNKRSYVLNSAGKRVNAKYKKGTLVFDAIKNKPYQIIP